MSQDVLEMVQMMNPQELRRQMAMQCAPLITGLKMSNLLMIPRHCEEEVKELLDGTDISWYVLRCTAQKVTMLLYRERELREYLMNAEVQEILRGAGYRNRTFPAVLGEMRSRYQGNRRGESEFPHEMGVFLGYPVADVKGFMEKRGQDFLYSGYWKVYEGVEEKRKIFRRYDAAKETLICLLHEGFSLTEILNVYRDDRAAMAV